MLGTPACLVPHACLVPPRSSGSYLCRGLHCTCTHPRVPLNPQSWVVSAGAGRWSAMPTERAYLGFPAFFQHYGWAVNDGVLDVRFVFSTMTLT